MLSLGTAIGLYSRASQIKSAVEDIGSWMRYLASQEGYKVRALLERLERRMDALQQPLSFCLMWCHDKGSCVSDVVFQARDVLQQAEAFIVSANNEAKEKLVKTGSTSVGGSSVGASSSKTAAASANSPALSAYLDSMVVKLESFLVELEFAMSALNLALNVINASRSFQQFGDKISSSALLRASGRIREMHNMAGDLTCDSGILLQRSFTAGADSKWTKVYDEASMKVFHNLVKSCYELHVDESFALPSTGGAVAGNHLKFELENSIGFMYMNCEDLGIKGFDDDEKSTSTVMFDKGGAVFTWVERIATQIQRQYAFILSTSKQVSEDVSRSSFSTGDFRPLDVAYTVRLCIYENIKGGGTGKRSKDPFHTLASDEELWTLFSPNSA